MLQMEAIRDAILTGSELPFGAELAVRTQILIDAAQRSIREDGAAVPVGDSFGALSQTTARWALDRRGPPGVPTQ